MAAVAVAVSIGPVLVPTNVSKVAATAASERSVPALLTVLQMNLCNSGRAHCYQEFNNGQSVDEAIQLIKTLNRPEVITFDEVCSGDPTKIARVVPGYSSTFLPTEGKCQKLDDGQLYGIGLLVRTNQGSPHQLVAGPYSSRNQDSTESRGRDCVEYRSFDACVTHLSTIASVAIRQCRELMRDAARYAQRKPTIIAGDLNLTYGGSPDVQSCVPKGFLRQGDGSVQHVITSIRGFEFVSAHVLPMAHTDHPALEVRLLLK
jgi:hypothetical protein